MPNELLCLLTAKRCGIDVPETTIIDLGSGTDADILLASERFDRRFLEQPVYADHLPMPLRLHQEDFAQALGIPASQKYENGDRHLAKMFALLRAHSAKPIEDQLKLWDRIVFNWLIGNTDGHLKNYSLLYSEDLKTVRLAPAYDVINTIGYKGMTHEMAFAIGNAKWIEDVTLESFRLAAKEAGLGERMAMNRLDEMVKRFRPAIIYAEASGRQGHGRTERYYAAVICRCSISTLCDNRSIWLRGSFLSNMQTSSSRFCSEERARLTKKAPICRWFEGNNRPEDTMRFIPESLRRTNQRVACSRRDGEQRTM